MALSHRYWGYAGAVLGVAPSADGRLQASGGLDATVRLWAAPRGQLLATLQAHTGPVYGLAFGTDGRLLASGGLDGTARLWEPRRGSSLRILRRDRRYERMDLIGLTGVTAAQRAALLTLEALDHQEPADQTLAGLPLRSAL